MLNLKNYLKIKCNEDISADNFPAFIKLIEHCSNKYKFELKQVVDKNTYYIIGQK